MKELTFDLDEETTVIWKRLMASGKYETESELVLAALDALTEREHEQKYKINYPKTVNMTIDLDYETFAIVKEEIESGRYVDESDFIRSVLREEQKRKARIRELSP